MSKKLFIIGLLVTATVFTANTKKSEAESIPEVTSYYIEETPVVVKEISLPEIVIVEPVKEPELISLGEYKLTAYCSCNKCCGEWAECRPVDEYGNEIVYGSLGIPLKANYSIAVDPDVIPYGTEVIINGHTYRADDCGGAIKDKRIDVYFDNHDEALEFGVQYMEVFTYEN